ncbi:MAG: LamB/YcsF family protein, partial [Maribacter stanieri]
YNDIAKNETLATTFLKGIETYKRGTVLYVPYASVIHRLAIKNGFTVIVEAFADRNYNNDLSLVSRKENNALITKGDEVLTHLLRMHNEKMVKTITGDKIEIEANTFCIHGDTPSALQILMYITKHLPEHNLQLKS